MDGLNSAQDGLKGNTFFIKFIYCILAYLHHDHTHNSAHTRIHNIKRVSLHTPWRVQVSCKFLCGNSE